MTREKAEEILELLGSEGKVDKRGYISGCDVWTAVIQRILDMGELIFYDQDKGQMNIDSWPRDMDEEPERVMKFTAFNGGEMELRAVKGIDYGNHDHIEVWKAGKCLGYMHIHKDGDVESYGDC